MADQSERRDETRARDAQGVRRPGARGYQFGLTDPKPLVEVSALWRTTAQAATIGIFVVLAIAALYLARPVLLPVVTAVVIGLMLGPVSSRADTLGIHPVLSAIVLWLLVVAVFYGLIVLLASPLGDWIAKAPEIGANIKQKMHLLDRPIDALQSLRKSLLPEDDQNRGMSIDFMAMLQPTLLFVTPAIGQIVIFFGTLFFYLVGRIRLRKVLVIFFDEREDRLRMLKIMNDIEHNLTSYLSVVALINICVGIAAGVISYFVGLPNPLALAVVAFLLNFIPYIGALMMELIFLAVGLVAFPTLTQALIAPVLYLAFATLEGHFITPGIMGRRLTLNPLIVFLALVFWTWMWGPVGAFIAVPLLIVTLVITNHLFPSEELALPQ